MGEAGRLARLRAAMERAGSRRRGAGARGQLLLPDRRELPPDGAADARSSSRARGRCTRSMPVLERSRWQAAAPEADTSLLAGFRRLRRRLRRAGRPHRAGPDRGRGPADARLRGRGAPPRLPGRRDRRRACRHLAHAPAQGRGRDRGHAPGDRDQRGRARRHARRGRRRHERDRRSARRLVAEMLAAGADGLAFDPIVLAGAASADPHGTPSPDRRLERGPAAARRLRRGLGRLHGRHHPHLLRRLGQPRSIATSTRRCAPPTSSAAASPRRR